MFSFITVEERTKKVADFFGITKPKEMSFQEWNNQLFDMEMKWEEDNGKPFPI